MYRFLFNRISFIIAVFILAFGLGILASVLYFNKISNPYNADVIENNLKSLPINHTPEQNKEVYRLLTLYMQVMNFVDQEYYKEVNREEMIKASINGMMQSLDPHSAFLSGKDYEMFTEHAAGEFGGIGAQVTMDDNGFIKIITALDGSPAAKAGLQPNDYITEINDEKINGLSLDAAVAKLKGKAGTRVSLTILRAHKPLFKVTIIRELVKTAPVKYELKEGNIMYLRLAEFNEKSYNEITNAINANKDKIKGFILDLRNNPGGLLDQAKKISNTFLKKGEIVSVRPRENTLIQRYNADGTGILTDTPMIILINGGSASASEIVSGALKDHARATLVGTNTFGKGSVQSLLPISDKKEALKITIALYYTPSGKTINKIGIEPDVYISALGTKCEKELCTKEEKRKINSEYVDYDKLQKDEKPKDYQLDYAVELMQKNYLSKEK